MPLNDKLDKTKCVTTVWGKLIPEHEAYNYALRHIAAFTANIFQVMRILEPDFEKRKRNQFKQSQCIPCKEVSVDFDASKRSSRGLDAKRKASLQSLFSGTV